MSLLPIHINTFLRDSFKNKRGAFLAPNKVPVKKSKKYPRMEQIILPAPKDIDTPLLEALAQRKSCDAHSGKIPILEQYGSLFGISLKEHAEGNRPYPSGGALYPIETYLITKLLEDEHLTVYHYQPKDHALEKLWELPQTKLSKFIKTENPGTALIVLTAQWSKSSAKYGDYAYNLGLLEAGHVAQNLLLASTILQLHARPLAGFEDVTISEALDLNEHDEQTLYTITISA